eukprot:420915_1
MSFSMICTFNRSIPWMNSRSSMSPLLSGSILSNKSPKMVLSSLICSIYVNSSIARSRFGDTVRNLASIAAFCCWIDCVLLRRGLNHWLRDM